MNQFASRRWLVCYDVRDPKRLARVFRFLKKHGTPVQYSVFLVDANAVKIRSLLMQLVQIIDARADDVRAYGLPENPKYDTIGQSILPHGSVPGLSLR